MSLLHNLRVADLTILRVAAADLREESLQATGHNLFRIADGLGCSQLMVDMGEVDFLTSTALGKLVALNTRVQAGGGDLILVNVADDVYQIFEVTRLNQILDIRRASDGQSAPVALAS
jgi:anti-sigma B factor antagonist